MASRCKKFQANIFNKSKCQSCFRSKDQHSAEALEFSKSKRKVSKCGYLFVAPETFDFGSPLDRTRRWQRRFFVLYDDGELTYSVDENVTTVPQGVIDMNKCTDVFPAENITGHQYSVAIKTPKSSTYFKGTNKEETTRWHDVLVMYPRSIKTKHRRSPTYPTAVKTPEPPAPAQTHGGVGKENAPLARSTSTSATPPTMRTYAQSNGDAAADMRNRRHTSYVPRDWDKDEEKAPSNGYLGLDYNRRKDSTTNSVAPTSVKNKRLSEPPMPREPVPQTYRGVRSLKHKKESTHSAEGLRKSNSMHDLTAEESTQKEEPMYRSRSRDNVYGTFPRRRSESQPRSSSTSAQRALFPDDAPAVKPAPEWQREESRPYECVSPPSSFLYNGKDKNETDEHKMAKSGRAIGESPAKLNDSHAKDQLDDLMYMKKGWLLKQDEPSKDWHKHWFVLSGCSLKFYSDSLAEDSQDVEGIIDITNCHRVEELEVSRNYGFTLKTAGGDYILSAMTSGIRNNWIQALQKCMELSDLAAGDDKRPSRGSSPARRQPDRQRATTPDRKRGVSPGRRTGSPERRMPSGSRPLEPGTDTRSPAPEGTSRHSAQMNGTHVGSNDAAPWRRISGSSLASPLKAESSRRSSNESSTPSTDSRYSGPSDLTRSRTSSEDVEEAQGRRKLSCTWPYDKGGGGDGRRASRGDTEPTLDQDQSSTASSDSSSPRSTRSRSKSVEPSRAKRNETPQGRRSTYLEDGDAQKKSKELSPEEERALDEVEHNIRRIHRKSITEYVQQHKPQHFDKFETGSAFKADDKSKVADTSAVYSPRSRGRSDRPKSSYSPQSDAKSERYTRSLSTNSPLTSPASTPRRKLTTDVDRTKSPSTPRAPSAKIKDKSRTKSPRAKSPPPVFDENEVFFDNIQSPSSTASPHDDIIERKWREVEKIGRKGGDGSTVDSSSVGGDRAVVDLLETEVESLREQLERSQVEVEELQHTTSDLKAQLRAARREHHESMSDMDVDQGRFMGQIEDMQEEMDHATGYLSSRLAEHETRSEHAQQQVTSLQERLAASQEALQRREEELQVLRNKLAEAEADLETAESAIARSSKELRLEKERLESHCEDLQQRVSHLETDISQLEDEALQHQRDLSERDSELAAMREEASRQTEEVNVAGRSMREMMSLRDELHEKVQQVARLEAEVAALHEQLSEAEHQQEEQDEVMRRRLRDAESQLVLDKQELQRQLSELQQQLEGASKQARMSDNLNSSMADILREKDETIAQLEERLIESDSRMEELRTRLKAEEAALASLHDTVDHSTEEKLHVERELEVARAALQELEAKLAQLKENLIEERREKQLRQQEAEILRGDLERSEAELQCMADKEQSLQELVSHYKDQVNNSQGNSQDAKQHQHQTEARVQDLSMKNHELAHKCADLSKELSAARSRGDELEKELNEHREAMESGLLVRAEEVAQTRVMVSQLQAQLDSTESAAAESKQLLSETMQELGSGNEAVLQTELAQLQEKYDTLVKQTRRLREQLREAQTASDNMELSYTSLQQRWSAMEGDYKQQLTMMGDRVQDLTNKLASAEKKARRMEKRLQRRETKARKQDTLSQPGSEVDPVDLRHEADTPTELEREVASNLRVPQLQAPSTEEEGSDSGAEGDSLGRIKVLQVELAQSHDQIEELSEQLAEQASLTHQLQEARQARDQLQQQNHAYQADIARLQASLDGKEDLATCHRQLTNMLQELDQAVMPTQDSYTATVSNLRKQLRAILGQPTGDVATSANESCQLRAVVERFSLEAAAIREMVQLATPGKPVDPMEGQLMALQHAHARMLALQLRLERHQSAPAAHEEATVTYSRLLAERLVLQGKLRLLLERYQRDGNDEAADLSHEEQALRTHACQLASRAMVQGELVHVLAHLRSHMAQGLTQAQKEDILARELASTQAQLHARQNQVSSLIAAYREHTLHQLAASLLQQNHTKDAHKPYTDIGALKEALASAIISSAQHLQTQLETLGLDANKNSAIVDSDVSVCIESVHRTLEDIYQKQSGVSPSGDSSDCDMTSVVSKFGAVLAEEVVVRSYAGFLMKQVEVGESVDSWEENTHSRLSRHDSGLSSLPTSPIANRHQLPAISDSQVLNIPERMSQDAHTLRHLAAHTSEADLHPESDTLKGQLVRVASDLITLEGEMVKQGPQLTSHAAMVTRELLHTAQLELLVCHLKTEHESQMEFLQQELHALQGQGKNTSELEEEVTRLSELVSASDARLKRELEALESHVHSLQEELQTQEDNHKSELEQLEARYSSEILALQEDLHDMEEELDKAEHDKNEEEAQYKEKITQLESRLQLARKEQVPGSEAPEEMASLQSQLEDSELALEQLERTHQEEVQHLRAQVTTLETQLAGLQEKHQGVLDQAQSDLRMAVQAVSAQEADKLEQEVQKLRGKLDGERARHVSELHKLRVELSTDSGTAAQALLNSKVAELELQLANLQMDYEQELAVQRAAHRRELARSKDDMLQFLSAAELANTRVDEKTIRKKYTKDMDRIKEIYDRGFSAMERSHQKVLMEMRRTHKHELDLLRQEKDQLLAEETQATQAALDAMRKAHEAELQKERGKFLDVIAKTYSHNDVESLQKQHEEDLELIHDEIQQLSEQYSIKCIEYATMEDRHESQTRLLNECRRRITDLMTRNEELNLLVKHEIERLTRLVRQTPPSPGATPMRLDGEPPEVYDLRVAMRLKEVEVSQLENELAGTKDKLHSTTQELESSLEKYQDMHSENTVSKMALEQEVVELKRRLAELTQDDSEYGSVDGSDTEEEHSESQGCSGKSKSRSRSPQDRALLRAESEASHQSKTSSNSLASMRPSLRKTSSIQTEHATGRRSTWRQRQPERARSSPGLTAAAQLSLKEHMEEMTSSPERARRNTDFGLQQEKF